MKEMAPQVDVESMKATTMPLTADRRQKTSKIKVLLADDHPFVRAGVRSWLHQHNQFEVVGEASCGHEAISRAKEFLPDVIVMDLSMPGVDGMQATQSLRESCPKSRVLFFTIDAENEIVNEMIQSGAKGYVRKDTPPVELVSAIERIHRGETCFRPEVAQTFFNEFVLNGGKPKETPKKLSPRENQVLSGIVEGLANKEIADRLKLQTRTVEKHRQRMMKKLGIHKATELVKFALTRGLVNLNLL
jgi:DNA-binding NarL/FixJ family response regulator